MSLLRAKIPLYSDMLVDGYTEQQVDQAGFFLDCYKNNIDVESKLYLSEYNNSIFAKITTIKPTRIIALSGCFSPIHAGHISALTKAKEHYERLGETVLGVLTPAHDSYVDVKRNGTCKCPAIERIIKIKKYLDSHQIDWVVVDEHPALYMSGELNFPYLIKRLEFLYKGNLSFVFGSDNSEFIWAMSYSRHGSVIVNRNDQIDKINSSINDIRNGYTNFVVIEDNEYSDLSSTKVRSQCEVTYPQDSYYVIRDDSMLFNNGVFYHYGKIISDYITEMFNEVSVKTVVINAQEQLQIFDEYILKKYGPDQISISMDKYWKGTFQLNTSRVFTEFGYQKQSNSMVYRNIAALEKFVSSLAPNTNLLLVDDDIATGYSINAIKELITSIRDDITIVTEFIGNVYMELNNPGFTADQIYDIVDIRDFVFKAANGGLVVKRGRKHVRVPYVYPNVNLYTRAKIPYNKIIDFSEFINKINN